MLLWRQGRDSWTFIPAQPQNQRYFIRVSIEIYSGWNFSKLYQRCYCKLEWDRCKTFCCSANLLWVVWKSGDKSIFEQQINHSWSGTASFILTLYLLQRWGARCSPWGWDHPCDTWSLPAEDVIKISFCGAVQRFLLEIRRLISRNWSLKGIDCKQLISVLNKQSTCIS